MIKRKKDALVFTLKKMRKIVVRVIYFKIFWASMNQKLECIYDISSDQSLVSIYYLFTNDLFFVYVSILNPNWKTGKIWSTKKAYNLHFRLETSSFCTFFINIYQYFWFWIKLLYFKLCPFLTYNRITFVIL